MADPFAKTRILNTLFTRRQIDILEGILAGKLNKTIGYDLGMQEGTVKMHINAIIKKVDTINNRTELALWYLSMKPREDRHAFLEAFLRAHPCTISISTI